MVVAVAVRLYHRSASLFEHPHQLSRLRLCKAEGTGKKTAFFTQSASTAGWRQLTTVLLLSQNPSPKDAPHRGRENQDSYGIHIQTK